MNILFVILSPCDAQISNLWGIWHGILKRGHLKYNIVCNDKKQIFGMNNAHSLAYVYLFLSDFSSPHGNCSYYFLL